MNTYTLSCSKCDGEGKVPSNAFLSWSNSAEHEEQKMCFQCGGEGDVVYLDGEEEMFNSLADRLGEETKFLSSVDDMQEHPCYQTIKHMGAKRVMPLLLIKMAKKTTHLMAVLSEFVKKDHSPITEDIRGQVNKMTMAWIEWGIKRKYIHADYKKIRQGAEAREKKELDEKNKRS